MLLEKVACDNLVHGQQSAGGSTEGEGRGRLTTRCGWVNGRSGSRLLECTFGHKRPVGKWVIRPPRC